MSLPLRFKKSYKTLNKIEILESALLDNYLYLSKVSGFKITPVLKSNAYGHGLHLVAKVLDNVGAPFFCVDSLYEAYELLKIKIKTPILIMGYTHPDNLKVKKLPFSFAVYDKETLDVLHTYQPQAGIHVFVDTGMHREGISVSDLSDFLRYCKSLNNLKMEGLMSHFAASDKYTDRLTQEQVENFELAQDLMRKNDIHLKWIHIGNSSAILNSKKYKGKIGNLMRAGIDLYGIDPEGKDKKLKPALRVLTTINQIKALKKSEKVGYDFTYTAKKDMMIGILPYGYYDGLDRRLSNSGFVSIEGIACPIIGRVSMNIATIDITDVTNPYVGQDVVVFSNISTDANSIYNSATHAETIPYDLLVRLAESTKRIVVK